MYKGNPKAARHAAMGGMKTERSFDGDGVPIGRFGEPFYAILPIMGGDSKAGRFLRDSQFFFTKNIP